MLKEPKQYRFTNAERMMDFLYENGRPGDVLAFHRFFTGPTDWLKPGYWLSKQIQRTTKSPYQHVEILCTPAISVGAVLAGVMARNVHKDHLTNRRQVVSFARHTLLFPSTQDNISKQRAIADFALRQVNDDYDKWALLKIGWEYWKGLRQILAMTSDDDRWICSELVEACYRRVGLTLCPIVKMPTPGQLLLSKRLFVYAVYDPR